jgi:hypothetical protein
MRFFWQSNCVVRVPDIRISLEPRAATTHVGTTTCATAMTRGHDHCATAIYRDDPRGHDRCATAIYRHDPRGTVAARPRSTAMTHVGRPDCDSMATR